MRVRFLGQEIPCRRKWHPLQYSCWEFPWTEGPGRRQSLESQRVRHDLATEHAKKKRKEKTSSSKYLGQPVNIDIYNNQRLWTGRPGVLRFMGSQRVRHDWATELNWAFMEYFFTALISIFISWNWNKNLKDTCGIIWVQIFSGVFQFFYKSFTVIFPRFNLTVFKQLIFIETCHYYFIMDKSFYLIF